MNLHYTDFNWNGINMLLADDDTYCHLLLERIFKKTNANLIHAYNGKQAIDLAMKNEIDLAILDIVMPKFSGCEVAENIKLNKPNVICIAYTADALRIRHENYDISCFDKVIFKPMLAGNLFKEIENSLDLSMNYK